jgi:hypothetical protein
MEAQDLTGSFPEILVDTHKDSLKNDEICVKIAYRSELYWLVQ